MAQKLKILEVLSKDERAAFDAWLSERARTVDEGVEYLASLGYSLSRKAVWNYQGRQAEMLEGIRRSAEMARALGSAAREGGAPDMNDAIIARFQQLQMEWAFEKQSGGDLTAEEIERFAKSLNQTASAAQRNVDLKNELDALKQKQKDAIAAAEQAVKGGGAAVVTAIKKALGIEGGAA